MAWVLDDEEVEEDVNAAAPQKEASGEQIAKGWVLEDAESTEGLGIPTDPREVARRFDMATSEFGKGALDMLLSAFGGGSEGLTGQAEAQQMQQARPGSQLTDLESGFDQLTGGQFIPQGEQEQNIGNLARQIGEFGALEAVIPGSGTFVSGMKTGAQFGLGAMAGKEAGLGEVGQFITGAAASVMPANLAKSLVRQAKRPVQMVNDLVDWGRNLWKTGVEEAPQTRMPEFFKEGVTEKSLADLELSKNDIRRRTADISKKMLSDIEESVADIKGSDMSKIGTFRAGEIEKKVIDNIKGEILDTVSPIQTTQKRGWEGVLGAVEERVEAAQDAYRQLYDGAERAAKQVNHRLNNTWKEAKRMAKDMSGSLIDISEESGVRRTFQTLANELYPQEKEMANKLFNDLKKAGVEAEYQEVLDALNKLAAAEGNALAVPLDLAMKTSRSISRILQKSDIIPAPVDLLKGLQRALKRDILEGLEAANSPGLDLYKTAEKAFAEVQDTFNNDIMLKARQSLKPEEMSALFSSPSNLQKLNRAIGPDNVVKSLADRLLVEHIGKKGKDAAKEMARANQEFLSSKASKALDKLINFSDNLTNPGSRMAAESTILKEIQAAATSGATPTTVLNMMKDPVGNKLVRQTLSHTKQGRKAIEILNKALTEEMLDAVVKDGIIDFTKVGDILKNPQIRQAVKETMGEDGLRFFRRIGNYSRNMSANMEALARVEPSWIRNMADTMFSKGSMKVLAYLAPFTGFKSLAAIPAAAFLKEGLKRADRAKLINILKDPVTRGTVEKLGQEQLPPSKTKEYLRRLSVAIAAQEKQED